MSRSIVDTGFSHEQIREIRSQFPVLSQEVNGRQLVYLDNAATTQKPMAVIEALSEYYSQYNANIHRGIHHLAERATAAFEACRDRVQVFLGAAEREEIIFTRGTTEGINLVAYTWAEQNIQEGDQILVSEMDSQLFFDAITKPRKPSGRLKEALRDYLDFVKNSR